MSRVIYSGAGAVVHLQPNGSWDFAHDVLPASWTRTSGSKLTVYLREWARLPKDLVWVPTVRAFASPWEYGEGPDPRIALPRDQRGEVLALVGPVRCEAIAARANFTLYRGSDAIAAAQRAILARLLVRVMLRSSGATVARAQDARLVINECDWSVREQNGQHLLVAVHGERTLVARGGWVAAAGDLNGALATLDQADATPADGDRDHDC